MLRERLTRGDRWAIAVLVAIPLVLNVPFALASNPVLNGDNLTQNYPLRVLVGQLIAHGRLPLWDPAIWSGVPLLAGWNAGAMFPGTWLFAFMPPVAAYEVNVVGLGVVCGVGLHLFLRRQGCSPLASFLGAITFSEMGFMSGQNVHLGLVEGTALLPWMLIAIDGVAREAGRPQPIRDFLTGCGPAVALLAAGGGLTVLAGDPRAVSSNGIVAVIYAIACAWRVKPALARITLGMALAGGIAVAIGAAQWLPGLAYLHGSERAVTGLNYFGYYSLSWGDLPLGVTPYLFGGNGNFSMPDYAGPLNMPEVTYGLGILPLIALFALIPRLRQKVHGLGVWFVLFVAGALLSAGSNTPLGHVLARIPLYGGQRDQNRNAVICDIALSVLLALFVDTLRPAAGASLKRIERWLGTVPALAAFGLVIAMFAITAPMERFGGMAVLQPGLPAKMAPYYAVTSIIALGGLFVLWRQSWKPNWHIRAAAAVVVADVALFGVMASYQPIPASSLTTRNPAISNLLTHLPPGTRYAIDDPDQLALSNPRLLADDLGVNDLVILRGLSSMGGYGSAVPAAYEKATGTHDVENLRPDALAGPVYDDLDLGLVVVVPEQFGTIVPARAQLPLPPGPPVPTGTSAADRQPADLARFPYPPAGPWRLSGALTTWEMPAPARIASLEITFEPRYGRVPASARVVLGLANGSFIAAKAVTNGDTASVSVPTGLVAAGGGVLTIGISAATAPGLATGDSRAPVVGAVTVEADSSSAPLALDQPASGPVRYELNGLLQGLLAAPHWRYAGHVGPLVLYRNTRARGPAWLEAPGSHVASAHLAPGSVTSRPAAPWQDPVEVVDAPSPVLLVRSEQYDPSWSVTIAPAGGGQAIHRPVEQVGLIQGVELPAGRFIVTWRYSSPRAEIGILAGLGGIVASGLLVLVGLRARRRRRPLASPPCVSSSGSELSNPGSRWPRPPVWRKRPAGTGST